MRQRLNISEEINRLSDDNSKELSGYIMKYLSDAISENDTTNARITKLTLKKTINRLLKHI
jgi:hypothetical protein